MQIVHLAPFAPNACGMYEAARDMVVADLNAGHNSYLVDVGVSTLDGQHTPGTPDKIDGRGARLIKSADPMVIRDADIIIAHTGAPDAWLSCCQAPIIWILHGRPQACFKTEQFGSGNSFTLMAQLALWPRIKAMVTFWPYHKEFWKPIIPDHKLVILEAPPIDGSRFSVEGTAHDFGPMGGKVNIVLADSKREDVDLYEIANGVLTYARQNNDEVKFHFYGMDTELKCWDFLMVELKILGALGEVWARRANMQEVFRAADIVLSPHRITTRVIGEALCCGTPVLAARGCVHATWHCAPDEPDNVAQNLWFSVNRIQSEPEYIQNNIKTMAQKFSLEKYSSAMEEVFSKVL